MKIAFFHNGNNHFLNPIIEALSERHETRSFLVNDLQAMFDNMVWSDVSWFEWCIEHIVQASHLPRVCKNVCRLHRYEAFTNVPDRVKWDYVDRLILVSENLDELLKSRTGNVQRVYIRNGVDLSKIDFVSKRKGHNIGWIGYLNPRKNFNMALQIMKKLVDIDDKYMLYIAGKYQDRLSEGYVNYIVEKLGIQKNVIFCEWVDNINDWLKDINYILSTSVHESFGYGIAEGMSSGCKPIIHGFDGAEKIWGDRLFYTVDQAVEMIMNDEFNSTEYRAYIRDNYNFDDKIKEIEKMLKGLK